MLLLKLAHAQTVPRWLRVDSQHMLSDLLVLDLSRVLAGPYCTQMLADLGARVIKVESPKGDDTRQWGPPYAGGESGYYLSVNRGKESLAVDLKEPRGAEIVRRLALKADVIIENFKLGDLARYGLDAATVRRSNPGVVYLSITGFGQTGPRAAQPGYDGAMQAQSGLLAMTGEADGGPVKTPVAFIDVLTGVHASVAVLAALRRRDRDGVGSDIDISLFDVALASMVNQAQSALLTAEAPLRLGSGHPSIVPYQAFSTADGAVVLAVGNDNQFRKLCEVLGSAELAADERYATNAGRVANREVLVPYLQSLTASWARAELVSACNDAGVPATPVLTLPEALADPQAHARGAVSAVQHPTAGRLPLVASPLRFITARGSVAAQGGAQEVRAEEGGTGMSSPGESGATAAAEERVRGRQGVDAAPPLLGQHSREILMNDLGLDLSEVEKLLAAGVLVEPQVS